MTKMEARVAGSLVGHDIQFGEPEWDILTFLRENVALRDV
jgi:hypothetical protein